MALADYVGHFVPGAADTAPLLTLPLPWVPLVVSRRTLVALVAIALLTCVHVRGLGPGRLVQNALGGAKVAALAAFIAIGFAIGHGHVTPLAAPGAVRMPGLMMAFIPVMFTYSGWNAAVYVAEEVRSPGRNVPLALGLGTLTVVAIYLGLNALYLYALPAAQLGAVQGARLIDTVAERLFGVAAGGLLAAFTIVSIAASVSAMIIAGPRVYFAMARDGLFPGAAARVHPRFRVPVVAVVAQSIWSGVLVLSGTLAQLVSYTGFALVLFAGVAVSTVFVLRRRVPEAARPFSAWGYPWAPAAFVAASALMIVNEIWRSPGPSAAGLAVIASGLPVYWWMTRRKRSG
jgi:APA family basic amino acid/polyamine antiporter